MVVKKLQLLAIVTLCDVFSTFSAPFQDTRLYMYKLVNIEKTPIQSWDFQVIKIGTAIFMLHEIMRPPFSGNNNVAQNCQKQQTFFSCIFYDLRIIYLHSHDTYDKILFKCVLPLSELKFLEMYKLLKFVKM